MCTFATAKAKQTPSLGAERDAGGRRAGADAGLEKEASKKKFAKNLVVKNKGSTFVTAFPLKRETTQRTLK